MTALVVVLALGASGCGLLETNDDEIEQLRAEIVQLREDMIDLETEVSVLASQPAPTVAPTTTAATTAATTTTEAPGSTDEPATTTTEASGSTDEPATTTEAPAPVVDEETVLTFAYEWGPSDEAAALQTLLGITADGWYGPGTQAAHIAATETLTWQRSHRQPRRIILVAYNAATYKAYQSALAALGQPVEPSTSAIFAPLALGLPPAAAH